MVHDVAGKGSSAGAATVHSVSATLRTVQGAGAAQGHAQAMAQPFSRKIIQISQARTDNGISLFALCDDGSLWHFTENTGSWLRVATTQITGPHV